MNPDYVFASTTTGGKTPKKQECVNKSRKRLGSEQCTNYNKLNIPTGACSKSAARSEGRRGPDREEKKSDSSRCLRQQTKDKQ